MDGNSLQLFYQSALNGLETGILMPWDRQLLSVSPLPDSVIEPFTTKEMPDVLSSMKMTYDAMVIWIDEAKKVNYFSKRFVQLSRMVMNGVTTMARGLITLHGRGEDLNESPMSIKDLLAVASYHFRKSYLGVLQTSRSHPEIGERLLMNQIGWNNILMRLFKTRDKLTEPVKAAVCNVKSESIEASENRDCLNTSVQSGKDEAVKALPASGSRAYSAPSAFAEPGAYNAPRAFSSYDKASSGSGKKNPAAVQKNEMIEENPEEMKEIEKKIEKAETKDSRQENEKTLQKSENQDEQNEQPEMDKRIQENPETEGSRNPTVADKEIHKNPDPQKCSTGEQKVPDKSEEHLPEVNPVEEPIAAPEPDPIGSPFPESEDNIPGYLKILQDIYARSDDSDSGTFTMSFEEIRYLASDPDFNLIYPEAASEMKALMQNFDSS